MVNSTGDKAGENLRSGEEIGLVWQKSKKKVGKGRWWSLKGGGVGGGKKTWALSSKGARRSAGKQRRAGGVREGEKMTGLRVIDKFRLT